MSKSIHSAMSRVLVCWGLMSLTLKCLTQPAGKKGYHQTYDKIIVYKNINVYVKFYVFTWQTTVDLSSSHMF